MDLCLTRRDHRDGRVDRAGYDPVGAECPGQRLLVADAVLEGEQRGELPGIDSPQLGDHACRVVRFDRDYREMVG